VSDQEIVVGLIDDPVAMNHPGLASGNIRENPVEMIPSNEGF
jgi:hypothetical protein